MKIWKSIYNYFENVFDSFIGIIISQMLSHDFPQYLHKIWLKYFKYYQNNMILFKSACINELSENQCQIVTQQKYVNITCFFKIWLFSFISSFFYENLLNFSNSSR